jgi:hypothetical protein
MAKLTPRYVAHLPFSKAYGHKTHLTLSTGRVEKSGGARKRGKPAPFFACVHFKTGGWTKTTTPGFEPSKLHGTCVYARNPRIAAAGALRKAAKSIGARSGAFAGYSKVNRKTRRTARKSKRS